jgi:4-amino-4-deoxy-L-arabinose transferase-like glycosyltransferase
MLTRPRLLLALLILASGGLYLLGNGSVALWDRDEPRYAQTSRQMFQSGDWVVPHYLDNVRTAKPALIYWCQASAMEVFGDNAFAARFPSAVAVVLLLVILSFVLWRTLGPERTVWTVFILATSGLVIAAAKMCITDAVLLLWVTIAQLCLYAMWRGRFSWLVIVTLAAAIGLAGLTKGPVVLGFLAMTLIVLGALTLVDRFFPPAIAGDGELLSSKDVDDLRPASTVIDYQLPAKPARSRVNLVSVLVKITVGLLIVAAITLPWILMVNHRASTFLQTAVGHDVWDRMMTPLEQHWGPPGYYVLVVFLTFFPWSLLLPLTIGLAVRHRANPKTRFALAAVLGPWVMLECIRTKLPFYILPVFPPLAFLAADALVRCLHGEYDNLKSQTFVTIVGLWSALIALLASATWLAVLAYHAPLPWAAMGTISLLGILFGLTVFLFFKARRAAAGAAVMGVGTMILVAVIYGWYLPRADFLRISPRVAKVLIAHGVTQPHQVIMLDYMEPSLAFHQGGTMREAGEVTLSRRSIAGFTPWMVVTSDIWKKAAPDIRGMFDIVASVHGLAYADKGRWMDVMVIQRKDANKVEQAKLNATLNTQRSTSNAQQRDGRALSSLER